MKKISNWNNLCKASKPIRKRLSKCWMKNKERNHLLMKTLKDWQNNSRIDY